VNNERLPERRKGAPEREQRVPRRTATAAAGSSQLTSHPVAQAFSQLERADALSRDIIDVAWHIVGSQEPDANGIAADRQSVGDRPARLDRVT
jgi:hypothetical protein